MTPAIPADAQDPAAYSLLREMETLFWQRDNAASTTATTTPEKKGHTGSAWHVALSSASKKTMAQKMAKVQNLEIFWVRDTPADLTDILKD